MRRHSGPIPASQKLRSCEPSQHRAKFGLLSSGGALATIDHCQSTSTFPNGFSLVELQIAFVVLALSVAGLSPLVVMQSRHLKKLEARYDSSMTYYVIPSRDEWARKLGASATVRTTDPGPPGVDPDYQLDDGDAAVTVTGSGWNRVEDPRYFQDDQLENSGGSGAESVTWNFSDLDVGWYDVRITWRKDNDHSKKARYEIFDGTTSLDSFTLNQREAPSGPRVDGVRWESVGVYPITSGSLAVELTDKGSSTVVADGVMLVPVTNSISVNSIEKSMDDESVTAHVSVTENTP